MTDAAEPETTEAIYDRAAARWERNAPVLLSDFTARPFLLDWCEPEYARVLDLGCGEGYVARQLGERGARSVHGIDVSAEMVERAKSQAPDHRFHFESRDATDLSHLPENGFDLAVAVFMFNYMDTAAMTRVMEEVVRVVEPGGRFVFSVPHPSLPFVRVEERPFYFSPKNNGYFGGRDVQFEGEIWRRDGESVRVRCVHKTLDDYFRALRAAGFQKLPDVHELHVTDEHVAFDPDFFGPLVETPLHLAFRLEV
ncbi:MAG: class I SAM-dependent methyltransferase [Planctomycetota bacterium]